MALSDRLYKSKQPVKSFDTKKEIEKAVKTVVSERKPEVKTTTQPTESNKPIVKPLVKQNTSQPAYGTKGYMKTAKGENIKPVVNPLATGLAQTVSLGATGLLPGYNEALKQSEKQFPTLTTVGKGLGYLFPASAGTKLVKPLITSATAKVGKLGATVLEGALVGTGITAGESAVPVAKGEKTLTQAAKDVGTGLVTGTAIDVGLYGLGKVAKPILAKIMAKQTLSQSEKVAAAKQMNVPVEEVETTIQRELGLSKETTAQDFMKQQEQVAKDIEAEQYMKSFEKDPNQLMNDFTEWRKQNFGGAYGKMSNADNKALKQLYKEDTGIDLDEEINNSIRNMQNRAIGVEPTKPLKPVSDIVRPIVPMTKQQAVKAEQPSQLVKPLLKESDTLTDTTIDTGVKRATEPNVEPTATPKAKFEPNSPIPEGMKLSKTNETFTNAPITGDELVKRIKENPSVYQPTTREAQKQAAKKIVDDDFEAAVQMVRTGDKFKSDIENAVGYEVFKKLQQEGRYDDAFEVMSALSKKGTAAGKDIESFKIWSTATPEGMQRYAQKALEESTTKADPKFIAEVGDRMRTIQSIGDTEQLKNEVANRIKNPVEKKLFLMATKKQDAEKMKEVATSQLMADVFRKIDPEQFQKKTEAQARKISTAQAISQLLSLVTFQRNLYGNLINLGAEQLAKYPAALADSAASLITGKRSISAKAPKWKQSIQQGLDQAGVSVAEILAGVQRNTGDKEELILQPAFANVPVMRELEKALSLSLSTPDELFKGFVAADSMHNQLRARIGKAADSMSLDEIKKALTPQEFETAISEAKYATFQNDSLPSVMLSKMKNVLNIAGYGGETLGTKQFGAGDLIIKYTKVPGNIIARGVEFSPVGYMKTLSKMAELARKGDAKTQREFAQSFGRATTGTGLMSLGALLYDKGLIVGEESGLSVREKGLSTAEGKRGYKLNVSALNRMITGDDPDIKKGDTLISFDSIQPISIPITVGAGIKEEAEKEGISPKDIFGKVSEKTFNEVLDMPSLYTINAMYNASRKEGNTAVDVLQVPLLEAAPGFVPAISRQTAQAMDTTFRETKGVTPAETSVNKMKANIPGLSKSLEPKITPTGEVSKREKGVLTPFIDPFKTTTYKPTGYTDKLNKIKELSDETKHFPATIAPNSVVIKDEKVTLTPKQKTIWMQTVGQYVNAEYQKVLSNVDTSGMTPREAKLLSDRLSKIQDKARERAKKVILNTK